MTETKLLLNGVEVTVPAADDPAFEAKVRAELARVPTLPKASENDKTRRILSDLAGAATAVATLLPEPGGIVARVIAAALGVASAMLSQGATPQQAVDAIKRVRHLDVRADDAAVDAKNAAKPSGTAHTLPAPSVSNGPPRCDLCGVAFSEANCVNEDCPLNDHTRRGEPGEGD